MDSRPPPKKPVASRACPKQKRHHPGHRADLEAEEIRALYRMSAKEAAEIIRQCGILTPTGKLRAIYR